MTDNAAQHAEYVAGWRAEDCCPLDHCNCPVGFHGNDWLCTDLCDHAAGQYMCERLATQDLGDGRVGEPTSLGDGAER